MTQQTGALERVPRIRVLAATKLEQWTRKPALTVCSVLHYRMKDLILSCEQTDFAEET